MKEIFPCAAGPRAAAPIKPGFGLRGRSAAEREQKILRRTYGALTLMHQHGV